MRSRTGCLTCRQRKLKCDEKKPVCGQCCKASRDCVPSLGIVFRHQHNASMNGDQTEENTLRGFYAYKNTFDREVIWLDIPKDVTFINITNPYLDPLTSDFDAMPTPVDSTMDSPTPLELLSNFSWTTVNASTPHTTSAEPFTVASTATFNPPDNNMIPTLDPMLQSPPTSTIGTPISPPVTFSNHCFHSALDHTSAAPPSIDSRLSSPIEPLYDHVIHPTSTPLEPLSHINLEPKVEQDHEIAFLLRWFSEGPGYWMDLYDLGTYFSSYVPIKARENSLLKYAAVAYSAKSLARVQRRKSTASDSITPQASTERYPDNQTADWYHKSTQYYDTAVSLLLQALKNDSIATLEFDWEPGTPRRKRRRVSSSAAFKPSTDELLAASAILCCYELLDASVPEWVKHLNGAKSLLVTAQKRMTLPTPTSRSLFTSANLEFFSKARRATFWNIARQDMLAAFINKTQTLVDTEDLQLWREAGLSVSENGCILSSNTIDSGYPEDQEMMKEDVSCNTLVWLLAKLVNFMAAGDDIVPGLGDSWSGVTQRTLLGYWNHLRQQFQTWYDGLPLTFKACARIDPSHTSEHILQGDNGALFPEVWYSIPMCASTMQCYHMSQIQLLMNKPHESTQGGTNVFARLSSYQSVLAACQTHSHEIVGMSMARPDDAVRIHSVQPLFTAGQCLTDPCERQVVIDILRDIESDIGWATEYRVKQLLEQWQLEEHEQLRTS